ncbi:MAG: hypothetical protein CL687_04165 [Candidatus Pelagibacter sp.]|nr:hypothetical protein [Candidatus Pelagibacter sp.]OUW23557.1 MAG: hypothetical protein CBD34_02695 [Rickettsiales bacterium TMED174]|tara:strand:+ start:85 stop:717 length:633 start_codon:yes stop_codon:yes gene_type:complete
MLEKLPKKIAIFPLSGVIYFPKTKLPLNIFEQRYLDLVKDAYDNNKLMGMVQSRKGTNEIYKVGCLGKISDFLETGDGRVLINLVGMTRFDIIKEIDNKKKYREFEVDYERFKNDFNVKDAAIAEIKILQDLKRKTKVFFEKNSLILNWKEFDKLELNQQINTIAMIAPVSNEEKQKLLETKNFSEKTNTLSEIIEFYLHEKDGFKGSLQ